jgi:CubicO group peptidase (beta-lactamase class C family)
MLQLKAFFVAGAWGLLSSYGYAASPITTFANNLESYLKGNAVGYSFSVSYKDQWVDARASGQARAAMDPPSFAMNPEVKFSTASLSKTITAAAAMKLLVPVGGRSMLDDAIGPYLPGEFNADANFNAITFRQLLQHMSGIRSGVVDYSGIINYVSGHPDVSNKSPSYDNTNYALFRFLIPKLANVPLQSGDRGMAYAVAFMQCVQQTVFNPVGLYNVSARSESITGLNYLFPIPAFCPADCRKPGQPYHGWDLGDMTTVVGSQGWILSTQDLAHFLRDLNYGNTIVDSSVAKQMRDNCMGYDSCAAPTGNGSPYLYWHKNGFYPGCGYGNCGEFQGELVVFSNDVSVAFFVNSNLAYKSVPGCGRLDSPSTLTPILDAFNNSFPVVQRISPGLGADSGGTDVDLFGTGFDNSMKVWFGNTLATYGVVCVSNSWCSTRSPAGSGVVNIFVEVNGIRSAPGPQFRYAKFPVVGGISPSSGPATDSTRVIIAGNNFDPTPGATTINFGSNAATGVSCSNAYVCTAIAPPGIGTVNVTATVNGITSVDKVSFTYTGVVTAISPNNGFERGGDRVSISGAGFVIGGSVFFGPNQAETWSCPTLTTCSAVSPAGVGTVDVYFDVNGLHGTTKDSGRFTYKPGSAKGWTQWHLPPPSIYNHGDALTNDPVTREVLYMVPQQGDSDLTFAWDRASQGWVLKRPPTDPRPSKGAFAFHEATGKAVLFGGLIDTVQDNGDGSIKVTYTTDNTTWIWDGMNWSVANPPVSPSARYRASIAYDAAHKKIVLFGGCRDYRCAFRLNDTWTWDGSTWKQESPTVSPSARAAAAMAYSPATGTVILFGGAAMDGAKNDTWAWDGQNWSELHPPNAIPPARVATGLAYSPADSGLVLYGGSTSLIPLPSTVHLDDTWIWNGSSWVQANTTTSPKMTDEIAGMTFGTALNAVVLIGGDLVWVWGGR